MIVHPRCEVEDRNCDGMLSEPEPMASDGDVPEPTIVFDLLVAFRRSKTMFVAVSLGVFDSLVEGPKTVAALATESGTSVLALERLLNACVGLKLLSKRDGRYANSPEAATYLAAGSPHRLTGYITYSNEVLWSLWSHLEDAVREGSHRWKQSFGWDGPIFSSFFHTETAMREFLMGMHGHGLISSPHVVAAFDLSGFRHLIDVGGATGHLAIAACQRYPNLEATVFDLPEAGPLAREIISVSTVADRVRFVAGDFFRDPLPPGDLHVLGRIIHDWNDEKIRALLRRVHDALPVAGSILLAEKLLLSDKSGPDWALMQDLNMLTCTEGRERTLEEYDILLSEAGFVNVEGRQTPSPLDAILATRP